MEKLAVQLDSFAEKIPTLTLQIDGLVAEVAGNSVTLNVGKKTGLRVGDKLAVVREIRTGRRFQGGRGNGDAARRRSYGDRGGGRLCHGNIFWLGAGSSGRSSEECGECTIAVTLTNAELEIEAQKWRNLTLCCLRPTLDFPPVQTIRQEG